MGDPAADIAELLSNPRRPAPRRHLGPTNAFIPFTREHIEQAIPQRFEEVVRRHPDRLALQSKDQALTYDALNRAANGVAHAILAHGGRAHEPVALLLEKGAAPLVATLGAFKAGRAYVPLDAAFPPERLRAALEDSGAGLVVTNGRNAALAAGLAAGRLAVLDMDAAAASAPAENPARPIAPDALAYIIYTSGSTGRPKGVAHTHRTALHGTLDHTNSFHICADDRLTFLYSFAFSASVKNALSALLNGAALFPYDLETEGVGTLAAWLARERITYYQSVATVFRRFVGTLTGAERFPALRLLYAGSETLSARDVALYKAHFPPECLLVATFGINETGTVRRFFLDHATPLNGSVVPAGYAAEGKEVLLLDDAGNPVGAGEVGEIYIKSRYLALGYWRRPDLTAAAFLPDPAGGDARIYRTGDLGRLLPDGCLIHLGRKDFQAKVRGQKVDVAAIEAALLEAANVAEAAVAVREDRPGDQRIVGYIVPGETPAPAAASLRRALAGRLPAAWLPSTFVVVDTLPRTATGKVDRRVLPAPDPTRAPAGLAAPRDALERDLVALWEEVLGMRPVGVDENFFDLGGHSLLAAELFAALATRYGRQLPLATLFQAPTVERLAEVLRQDGRTVPAWALVPIQGGGSRPPLFCVHQHTGHLFCYQDLARHLGPDQPVYGLAPPSLGGLDTPHARIEDMAAEYIRAIRTVQPEGPYRLAGYCFGGTVAFEMARQLHARGQPVGLLALIEAAREDRSQGIARAVRLVRRRLAYERDTLARLSAPERIGYVLARAVNVGREQVQRVVTRARDPLGQRREGESYLDRAIRRIEAAHVAASRRYLPQLYPGRIVLFRAARLPARHHGDPYLGWAGLAAGGIAVEEIPGEYRTIVEDTPARLLAERLTRYLAVAGARP